MKYVITSEQMKQTETAFMEKTGYPSLLLMEHAAQAVADALCDRTAGGAVFFCGPGNNGGDGYAAARLFARKGRRAVVWAMCEEDALSGDARLNAQLCRALGVPVTLWQPGMEIPAGCGAVVDALFGTGLARPLSGAYAQAAEFINACGLPVLAVDMPSGTKELMVRADTTVTFHKMKLAHALFPGRENMGRLIVADIGIPEDGEGFSVLEDGDVSALLPARGMNAHKGVCGHALVIAGSLGMAGAAALCANAAMRAGAGLCTILAAGKTIPILQELAPCAMCLKRGDTLLADALAGKSAVAVGPGLGRTQEAAEILTALCAEKSVPQVWDADALNWLAEHPEPLGVRAVMTPHPGEAARLLGCDIREVTADPIESAVWLSEKFGCTALLKGATTVIARDGQCALNLSGTPGMATGGSGDTLTGIIAALLGQGLSSFDAARLGAFLHGRAGERAAEKRGVRSMIASDIIDVLDIG